MSDLPDAIRAFMVKYPEHVELTWQRPARKPASAAQQALATAVCMARQTDRTRIDAPVYNCTLPTGHDGPHADGGYRWEWPEAAPLCEDCEHPCGPGACGCPDECPAVKG